MSDRYAAALARAQAWADRIVDFDPDRYIPAEAAYGMALDVIALVAEVQRLRKALAEETLITMGEGLGSDLTNEALGIPADLSFDNRWDLLEREAER